MTSDGASIEYGTEKKEIKIRGKKSIWFIATLQKGPPPALEIMKNGQEVKIGSRYLGLRQTISLLVQ